MKYKSNCTVCMASKKDVKLRNRIRYAAFKREQGDETLGDIAKEFGFSTNSIYNHAKKHIQDVRTEEKKAVRVAKKIADVQAQVQKEAELQLDRNSMDDIDARPMEIVGLDEYIAQGVQAIRNGEMKMTANSFLGAVKIKTDWAAKQTTNKIELMRTIAAFRSGKNKKVIEGEVDGDTSRLTEGSDRGEGESYSIYRAAFGNASSQGSEEVSNRDDQTQDKD